MNAVLQPSSPNTDANGIREEIERLSQQQSKALEIALSVGMSPAEQNQYDRHHSQIVNLLRQLTALNAGECSKLSAKMVELSLQEAQRAPTVRQVVPNERGLVSSPVISASIDLQGVSRPSFENAERTQSIGKAAVDPAMPLKNEQARRTSHVRKFAVLFSRVPAIARKTTAYWGSSAAARKLHGCWKSLQTDQWLLTLTTRILDPVTLAAERSATRLRTGLLIGQLRRRPTRAAHFVADRISATNVYRCRDCGREVGFRSHPHTFIERYILPLLFIKPVRCAACFRRDYWPILTTVHGRSHREDEMVDQIHRNLT
jgi:hypothetical protein